VFTGEEMCTTLLNFPKALSIDRYFAPLALSVLFFSPRRMRLLPLTTRVRSLSGTPGTSNRTTSSSGVS